MNADGTPRLARSPMLAQSVIRSESGKPLQLFANPRPHPRPHLLKGML